MQAHRQHACESKAPAADVGRLSRAFSTAGCGRASASVQSAAKVSEANSERDAHRVFRKFGVTLPVPISELKVMSDGVEVSLPYLKPSNYLSLLLRKYPKLLFGGKDGASAQDLCQSFWEQFRAFQPDHIVFSRDPSEFKRILPICVHGDKGRTYMKLPIFCFSVESVFGLPTALRAAASKSQRTRAKQSRAEHGGKLGWTCGERAAEMQDSCSNDAACPVGVKRRKLQHGENDEGWEMPHNGRGFTYLTRFLTTAIPSKTFKAHPEIVPGFLDQLRLDFTELFNTGLKGPEDELFRMALVGVKGDYEFFLEVGQLSRSYQNIGTTYEHEFCPECSAGQPNIPAMDMSPTPAWTATLYAMEPWQTMPVLNRIPFAASKPATLYRRDMFHTLKYGFLKDLVAGGIMYLAQLCYFDVPGESRELDNRLQRAYSYFKLYCMVNSKVTTLRKFSKGSFHRDRARKFPFIGGKGADAIIGCEFLLFFVTLKLRAPLDPSHVQVLSALKQTLHGALTFCGIAHAHGIFMPQSCAAYMLKSGYRLLKGYSFLAQRCIAERRRFFCMRPKCHYFHHMLWDLQIQVQRGDVAILNYAAVFNCEANEDFIGRISRVSRRVSPRLATLRTVQRYLIGCKMAFKRAGL